MRRILYTLILGIALCACHHPDVELVNFSSFEVLSVKSASVFDDNGLLNPDVMRPRWPGRMYPGWYATCWAS